MWTGLGLSCEIGPYIWAWPYKLSPIKFNKEKTEFGLGWAGLGLALLILSKTI